MSLTIVIFLASASGLVGIALGYYLRLIISLGKRGSMELEIKKMELDAEENAKKVVLSAENKAAEMLQSVRQEAKEREDKLKVAEERAIKKEDSLDARQKDLDQEVESLKTKIIEIKTIKDRADGLLAERNAALEKAAGMSESEAKDIMVKQIEEKYGNDLLVRMQKFEVANQDKIEAKAKDIIATAIQRLGNSVTADVFSHPFRGDQGQDHRQGRPQHQELRARDRRRGDRRRHAGRHHPLFVRSYPPPGRPHGSRGAHQRRPHPAGKDREARR
jgi:ribonuclease Y